MLTWVRDKAEYQGYDPRLTAFGEAFYRECLRYEGVRRPFTQSSCRFCDFQGATDAHCRFRVKWTLDGEAHNGCFNFDDFGPELVPAFFSLTEQEYGLRRKGEERRKI